MSAKTAAEQLTEDQVRAIWTLHQIGGWRHRQLAAMFGTTVSTVSKIVTGKVWTQITGGGNVSRYREDSEYRDAHIAARLAQGVSSYTQIGRELGISRQAVSQRVRHMERSS